MLSCNAGCAFTCKAGNLTNLLLHAAKVAAAHLRLGFMYENGISMRVDFKVMHQILRHASAGVLCIDHTSIFSVCSLSTA